MIRAWPLVRAFGYVRQAPKRFGDEPGVQVVQVKHNLGGNPSPYRWPDWGLGKLAAAECLKCDATLMGYGSQPTGRGYPWVWICITCGWCHYRNRTDASWFAELRSPDPSVIATMPPNRICEWVETDGAGWMLSCSVPEDVARKPALLWNPERCGSNE